MPLSVVFLLPFGSIGAQSVPVISWSALSADSDYFQFTNELEIWHDREAVAERPAADLDNPAERFTAADAPRLQSFAGSFVNYGAQGGTLWLRFTVERSQQTEPPEKRWLSVGNPRLWQLDLFAVDAATQQLREHRRLGNVRPFARRELASPIFAFALDPPPGRTIYYLRAWNRTTLQLPLAIRSDAGWNSAEQIRLLLSGGLFGFFAALLAYNLLMLVTLRERNFIHYVVLLLSMGLFGGGYTGLNYQYLVPHYPGFNQASIPGLGILSLFAVIWFTGEFLHSHKLTPKLQRFLRLVVGLLVIALGLLLWGDSQRGTVVATIASLTLSVGMIYGAMYLWHQKNFPPARYYLFSWGVFYAAILVHGAIQFGFLDNEFFMNYSLILGAALAMLLLSLGMAARLKALDRGRYELATQLAVAREIQHPLLPPRNVQHPRLNVAYLYEPMEAVGGDFVDVHIREDGTALFAVADVTGHGVPAALLSSMIKMALRVAHEVMEQPALALARLHEAIKDKMGTHHITVCFCYVDARNGILRHASAGHPPPLIVRQSGQVEVIESEGLLLHPLVPPQSTECETRLTPGDLVLLYTDGIIETENAAGKYFGEERLQELVGELSEAGPRDLVEELMQYSRIFAGGDTAPLNDDLTLLAFEYRSDLESDGGPAEGLPETST